MAKYCFNCGTKVREKDRFCSSCGTTFGTSWAAAAFAKFAGLVARPRMLWLAAGLVGLTLATVLGAYLFRGENLISAWSNRTDALPDDPARQDVLPVQNANPEAATGPGLAARSEHAGDIAYLGVEFTDISADRAKSLGLGRPRGAEIRSIASDSPAERAGLKVTDVVLQVDDAPVADMRGFSQLVAATTPGQSAGLVIWRNGAEQRITTIMGAFLRDALPKAEAGDIHAMRSLAAFHSSGRLGSTDPAQGVSWLRKAAEAGDADSAYRLAIRKWTGNAEIKNRSEALRWFERAALEGHVPAMLRLGETNFLGLAGQKNFAEAMRFYMMAAVKGNAEAMRWVGNLHRGWPGTKRDMKEAARWYREAADKGDPSAMYNLAVSYHHGQGLARNFEEAVYWYQKAVDLNYATPLFNLAMLYHEGQGVKRDYRKAAVLAVRAIEAQHDHAIQELTTNSAATNSQFRRELQRVLQEKGAYDGAIDGRFGAQTNEAIKWLAERAEARAQQSAGDPTNAQRSAARSAAGGNNTNAPVAAPVSFAGLKVEALTTALRSKHKIVSAVDGLVVTAVDESSLAAQNGIKPGSVIVEFAGNEVTTPEALSGQFDMARRSGQKMVLLLVANAAGDIRFIALPF